MAKRKPSKTLIPEEEIAQKVYDDVLWAREFRDTERSIEWLQFYKLYRNFIDKTKYPYGSKTAIPTAFTFIEVQVSFIIDMIMEGGTFVEVLGKTPEGQAAASSVQDLLDYQFRHSFRIYEDMSGFVRQLLMYGTSIYKADWNYKPGWRTETVTEVNDETGEETVKDLTTEVILESNPQGRVVDLYNFGVDPNASHVGNARFAFEEMYVDPFDLIEKERIGLLHNVFGALEGASNPNKGLVDRMEEVNLSGHQRAPMQSRSKVHIIDWWGDLTAGDEGEKYNKKKAKSQLYHVILALSGSGPGGNGNPIVFLAEPTPFAHNKIPFVDARINACPGEFYGVGDIEYCESLLVEQRDQRNIMNDNLVRLLNNMFKVRRGADIDEGELVARPGQIIHVDDPDDVDVLDFPGIDPAAFKSQDDIRRDIESATGVNDFVRGDFRSATGFNDTASGITIIQNAALKRIAHKGQIVQRSIRDLAMMVHALNAQYLTQAQRVRILSTSGATKYDFVDVSPDALQNEYDFNIVNTPSVGSKQMRQQQLIQVMQILLSAGPESGLNIDKRALFRRLLDEMEIPNADEILGHEEFLNNQPPASLTGEENALIGRTMDLLPPAEENRLMSQGQTVIPKLNENHPVHMIEHQDYYNSLPDYANDIKALVNQHYETHAQMLQTSKDMMATAVQQDQATEEISQQAMALQALQGGQRTTSPNAAGGVEPQIRQGANVAAGNF